MRILATMLLAALVVGTAASAPPYDESMNPHVALSQALQAAQQQHKDVLVVFGANWCPDCRELDAAMHGSSATLINARFVVVKVDVGNFNKNLDIVGEYGNPIRMGIPAAVVLDAANTVLYATKAGELANARRMGEHGIYDFFSKRLAHLSPESSPPP